MTKSTSLFKKLEFLETESIKRGIPILGREKGQWLFEKILETHPKKILELGTANGYSGIILGSEGAELTTIDIDKEITKEAQHNFKEFNIHATILLADGVQEIKKFNNETFDLVFIDFAKKKYITIFEDALRVVKKNGFIIADNITFLGCQDYKEKVLKDKRIETELILIEDGLSCSKKIFF